MAAAMEEDVAEKSPKKPLQSLLGDLLSAIAATISNASHVSLVLASLHSLASLLFSVPGDFLSREDRNSQSQLDAVVKLAASCRRKAEDEDRGKDPVETLRQSFYGSSLFPTLATLLLHQVAPDWLACFPSSGPRWLFDEFFKQAPAMESLLNLAPFLALDHGRDEEESDAGLDSGSAVSGQAKRLLNICLIQQHGVQEIALSLGCLSETQLSEGGGGKIGRGSWLKDTLQVAQLVASIPDRVGAQAPAALQSPAFYQSVSRQLVSAGEIRWAKIEQTCARLEEFSGDGTFVFIGEVISRLCRRGHADVTTSVFLPVLMQHVEQARSKLEAELQVKTTEITLKAVKMSLQKSFWPGVTASIKDSHAMEKWVEALLKEMAGKGVSDWQAYCILWMTFGCLLSEHTLTRMVFMEKCLFVKILPIRCLKWVLQFAVLHSPPTPVALQRSSEIQELHMDTDVVRRLAQVWSSNDFIRSASLAKQTYLTAAVGICVRAMNKGDMEKCGDLTRSILQGVTNRLESPLPLVREMAKRLALVFSLVVNPANPLLLDDDGEVGDLDDWDSLNFKAVASPKETEQVHAAPDFEGQLASGKEDMEASKLHADPPSVDAENRERRRQRRERREHLALEEDDPDAVVNLGEDDGAWLGAGEMSAEDFSSDSDSEGSLQPYDMSDDESELERRKLPSQLRDCAANLRKPDDPDAVEKALQVAEQLIRAMPVELDNVAEELARALVHVKCSAIAIEGEEDTMEERRHGALVALLACAPLSSVVIITGELFSPNLDISQRLLLLDVMSDAAQQLAGKTVLKARGQLPQRGLISELVGASHQAPWYGPGQHRGPAGAGPWSEVPALVPGNSMMGWAQRYERELPTREGDRRLGKSRKFAPRSMQLREERQRSTGLAPVGLAGGENLFAPVAAAFMLPVMRDYDKKSHGVDFLESGFIVLGKILYTLGVCMECITAQPEAAVLGAGLLDLLRSRAVATHPEAYVRRAALFAASRVIVALHPSQVVSAVTGMDSSIAAGLEWVREWALGIANSDPDRDCSTMAMACVQLHSEMALRAMRAIQTLPPSSSQSRLLSVQTKGQNSIILPF